MSKVIIGLVGSLASGKETTKKYLIQKYSAQDCRFSSILRDVLERVAVSNSRENLQKISTVLRANFGEDLLSKAIATLTAPWAPRTSWPSPPACNAWPARWNMPSSASRTSSPPRIFAPPTAARFMPTTSPPRMPRSSGG